MAVDREKAEAGLKELTRAYSDAQKTLLAMIRETLLTENLGRRTNLMRRWTEIERYLRELGVETNPIARTLIQNAWTEGDASVTRLLPRDRVGIQFGTINREAMEVMQSAFTATLEDTRRTVGRQTFDVYRRAGLRSTAQGLLGARGSSRAVSQDLLERLQARGVKGFTDKLGRQWDLRTYTNMVARTTTREAVVQAQIQRMASQGLDLARVSSSGNPCPICAQWQGVLVSLSGNTAEHDGEPATTLDAMPNGGPPFHGNCRHYLTPEVTW